MLFSVCVCVCMLAHAVCCKCSLKVRSVASFSPSLSSNDQTASGVVRPCRMSQWICTFAPGNLISFSGTIKQTGSQCVSLLSLKSHSLGLPLTSHCTSESRSGFFKGSGCSLSPQRVLKAVAHQQHNCQHLWHAVFVFHSHFKLLFCQLGDKHELSLTVGIVRVLSSYDPPTVHSFSILYLFKL